MLLFEQLDFLVTAFRRSDIGRTPEQQPSPAEIHPPVSAGRDPQLETEARALLTSIDATALAPRVRVEWNPRLRSAAGRAHFGDKLISLNPRLRPHGWAEIDRTLRHELAHLVAHSRAGRRRISPHGPEWRQACRDLGLADETRCHTLPFPTHSRTRRLLYRCPKCAKDFPRVRRIRRAVACLACCRRYSRGQFDKQFQLRLVHSVAADQADRSLRTHACP